MSSDEKSLTTCTQIASIPVAGHKSKTRHIAETDDGRLLVLETNYSDDKPRVMAGPFTVEQAIDHSEQILAGSARHITHKTTPLVLAAALLSLVAVLKKTHEPAQPGS
ncbi:hypothetical protein IWQ52_004275 [Labrenzia sp. EL_159]|nr:hypothetical protein [Labrenzia sp. EL_162]MBG6196739.1 hypothetical protein [Labrenzia sp. EL_159]